MFKIRTSEIRTIDRLDFGVVRIPNVRISDVDCTYRIDPSFRFLYSISLPETEPPFLFDGFTRDETSVDEKLPSTQLESINGLITSFRFMLEDEIAFALTQATPISQQILSKVR